MMTVRDLLDRSVEPLRADEPPQGAMNALLESAYVHLPVVDEDGSLVGLVTEQQVMDGLGSAETLEDCVTPGGVQVGPDMHFFSAARVLVRHELELVPATDEDDRYLGVLTRSAVFERFAETLGCHLPGAIVVLEMEPRDYSVAQVIHIVEQNDVKVLSVSADQPRHQEDDLRLTLKLNVRDAARVRHMLSHHGYRIVASFSEAESREDLQDRAEAFMRYLDV